MKKTFFGLIFLFISLQGFALEGLEELSQNLYEKNQEIISLERNVDSKRALKQASRSGFFPTLNAVSGFEQNKTDEMMQTQKGQVLYLEGQLNLFSGFKDKSKLNSIDIDF